LVRGHGPLDPGRAAAIVAPVAAALDAAHEAGLVHRDVKPANMLLDARPGRPEHVYLADFGLSKAALAGGTLTGTGQFLGTVDYCAPEQLESAPVDGRADQYALASAAFELLTGAPPFHREDAMAVIYSRLSEPPPALSSRRSGFPAAADAVFARALARDPAGRYGSCREFSDALRAAFGIGRYDAQPGSTEDPGHPPTEAAAFPPVATGPADPRQRADPVGGALRPATSPSEVRRPADPATEAWRPVRVTKPMPGEGPVTGPRRHRLAWVLAAVTVLALAGTAVAVIAGKTPAIAPGSSCRAQQPPASGRWSAGQSSRLLLDLGPGHADIVEGMAFSPDGAILAVGTAGGAAYLVSTATGSVAGTLHDPGGGEIRAVAVSCDGKLLATADRNGSTYLWDLAGAVRAAPSVTLADPAGADVRAVAFSPDGKLLATGDAAGRAYLWHTRAGTRAAPAGTLADPAAKDIQAVGFSPDGNLVATGDATGRTDLWHTGSGTQAAPVATLTDPASRGVQAIAFAPSGALLATGDATGATYLWNTAPGAGYSRRTLADPGATGTYGTVAVAFSADSATLAAGGYTGQTYLWDTASATRAATLSDPDSASQDDDIQAVVFSPRATSLATGNTRGRVYLWTPR
jgi:serine/threonine-protein kinase